MPTDQAHELRQMVARLNPATPSDPTDERTAERTEAAFDAIADARAIY